MDDLTTDTPPAKSKNNSRADKGYSHGGCARCKTQRIRCDEKKPFCGRCERAGITCPGYRLQLRWSTKYEFLRPDSTVKKPQKRVPKQRNPRKKPAKPKVTDPGEAAADSTANSEAASCGTRPNQQEQNLTPQYPTPSQHELCELLLTNTFFELPEFPDCPDFAALIACSPLQLGAAFSQPELDQGSQALNEAQMPAEQPQVPAEQPQNNDAEPYNAPDPEQNPSTRSAGPDVPSWQPESSSSHDTALAKVARPRYRLGTPPKPLNDPAFILVEFYFKETAQLFSCYDSLMNPFRTIVSRLWDSSPILCRTLQSMAAASLVEVFPPVESLGRRLRHEAIEMLENNDKADVDTLLAMLMLGGSASWYDPQDLGLTFFNGVQRKLATVPIAAFEKYGIDYLFFRQSITYWEMLLSYVAENDDLEASETPLISEGYISFDFIPHPWTGFARGTQYALQRIGRLIRRQRKLAFSRCFTSLAYIKQLETDMSIASELEEYLHNLSHPVETTVVDPGDLNTPVWHLLTLAEAYRSTGLIQIYHIFPDLLDRRLARDSHHNAGPGLENCPIGTQMRNEWLTTYAIRALKLLKSIPLESGTRDFQPFILVALSSELRRTLLPTESSQTTSESTEGLHPQAVEVSQMRHFIQSRLSSFAHILPPRPIHVCRDIITATWKSMDERQQAASSRGLSMEVEDVYWMDVMIENGWETTMA